MPKNASKRLIVLMVIIALIMIPLFTILTACDPSTATPSPSAKATPTVAPTEPPAEEGAYKGVVLLGDWHITMLQAKGFSNVLNPDGKQEGGLNTRNYWGNQAFIDHPEQKSEDETIKYFTVPVTGTALDCTVAENMAKLNSYYEDGFIPFMWSSNDANGLNPWLLPANTTKIMIGDWLDEKVYDDLARDPLKGVDAEWTKKLIEKELKPLFNKLHNRFPDAEYYVCGVMPPSQDWGHTDATKYPNSPNAGKTMDEIDGNLKSYTKESVAECNTTLKAFATEIEATFIDVAATDLVGNDGLVKAEYCHSYGDGRVFNNAGFQIYGDAIMDAMGLPKPSEENPDWFE